MKNKNLERAVILGLLLSTGVYGTAWAKTFNDGLNYNIGGFKKWWHFFWGF